MIRINRPGSSLPPQEQVIRLRATGMGLTDGVGHLGAVFGPIVAGALFAATASAGYIGWFAYLTIPGALIPAMLIAWFGINQRRAILELLSP